MKILILGGSGMLGHRLWINLRQKHEVWVTVRDTHSIFPRTPDFPEQYVRTDVDALNFDQVTRALASIQPDLVINCIGLIKQMGHLARDPIFSISLNALLPHRISLICRVSRIRMIHISTDCVFSGKKGNYTEDDQSDAEDLYGRTKYLGEVAYPPHTITLRTSIIGRELKNRLGLIEWFLSHRDGDTIQGYQRGIFTGFTTDEISRVILDYVIPRPDLTGVFHVSSNPISKYDLLHLVNHAYGRQIKILPNNDFFCDRSLVSTRFRQITGYQPPSWPQMIQKMADNSAIYDYSKG
ncbi:MAG TPA: SDR family oxidoreductase [Anaerolineaceae bacterium]|nr:SDR family oxidoreductase [Anaerolineaceae bacterium]